MQNSWQPLAFFSKKLNPVQQKYSAYDTEMMVIYKATYHRKASQVLTSHRSEAFQAHKHSSQKSKQLFFSKE